jgi:hypothetical protein
VVRHAVGAGSSTTHTYYSERNRALVSVRWGDPMTAVLAAVGLSVRAVRAVLFSVLKRGSPKYSRANAVAVVRAAADFWRRLPAVLAERATQDFTAEGT